MSEHLNEGQDSQRMRPGQKLRQLREASGMSLADVAQATRITRSRLEALERDDYESAANSPAHAIGYMRAYARLLDHPVEPWLSDLERRLRAQADLEKSHLLSEPVLVDASRGPRMLPWIGVLVAGVIVWVVGADFYGAQHLLKQKVTAPELVKLQELSASQEVAQALVTPAPAAPVATVAAARPVPNPAKPGVESTRPLLDDPSSPANSSPTEVINVGTPGAGDALVVAAADDCWIEVQDKTGKQLIAQLLRSGNNLRLFGVAPFSIKLGNARAISLWINSREIPVQPEHDRRTLRLVAGP
jgi:cytoskeleton protein RodZ